MNSDTKDLIATISENLKYFSKQAILIAMYDEPEKLKALAGEVLNQGQLLKRLANEHQKEQETENAPARLVLVILPDGKIRGWQCKDCGTYHAGNQRPRLCLKCGKQDFTSCWIAQPIQAKTETV
jgi:rubrerythrin